MTYPPEPWSLRGQLHASAFLVPASRLSVQAPPGWRPLRLAGRLVVGAVWVDYEPGGVLSYSELMVTVLVRRGRRVCPHIVAIWVDSEASRDGGRAHWAIPKELAEFSIEAGRWSARGADGPIASALVRPGRALLRVPVGFSIAQTRDDSALVSPVRARAGVGLAAVHWDAVPGASLGFLAGRRALASFTLRDFAMTFGSPQSPARTPDTAGRGGIT